jgi:hypothetical protein
MLFLVITPLSQQNDQLQYGFDFKGRNMAMYTSIINVNSGKTSNISNWNVVATISFEGDLNSTSNPVFYNGESFFYR